VRGDEYPLLRDALEKLHLNDASFVTSQSRAWRSASAIAAASWGCLHMEIVQERSSGSSGWS